MLARWYPITTAINVATTVGKAMAIVMGLVGLAGGNLMLVFVAFFVYVGASQEKELTVLKSSLDGLRVRDRMAPDVAAVSPHTRVSELLTRMMRERHTGYPVVDDGQVVGCVTFEDITKVAGFGSDVGSDGGPVLEAVGGEGVAKPVRRDAIYHTRLHQQIEAHRELSTGRRPSKRDVTTR